MEKPIDNQFQFAKGLEHLINQYSLENGSDTPDFILAAFLVQCLVAYNGAVNDRDRWQSYDPWQRSKMATQPGEPVPPSPSEDANP